jgi:hypothetical protein
MEIINEWLPWISYTKIMMQGDLGIQGSMETKGSTKSKKSLTHVMESRKQMDPMESTGFIESMYSVVSRDSMDY